MDEKKQRDEDSTAKAGQPASGEGTQAPASEGDTPSKDAAADSDGPKSAR